MSLWGGERDGESRRKGAGGGGDAAGAPPEKPWLIDFLYALRRRGLDVVPNEWFAFLGALEKGVAAESLTGFYYVARATLVKTEAKYDLFDLAFAEFFRNLKPPPEIAEAVEAWLAAGAPFDLPLPESLADYQGLDLEELIRKFEETLAKQNEQHDGGSKWVGTRGTSPYGRDGVHPGGIRVGGAGGGRMAVKIAQRRLFRDYRSDRTLDVRQVRVALRRLRDLVREGAADELDLDETIDETCKNAGEIELVWQRPRKNRVRLILMMDVGGSMDPYARLVERLFSAANAEKHWRHFESLYFHNCVYNRVWKDGRFREEIQTPRLIADHDGDTKLVIVGDACMAWSELFSANGSVDWYESSGEPGALVLRRLADHFRRAVWLNPMPKMAWGHPTVSAIGDMIPMFELTLDGITEAVAALRRAG